MLPNRGRSPADGDPRTTTVSTKTHKNKPEQGKQQMGDNKPEYFSCKKTVHKVQGKK